MKKKTKKKIFSDKTGILIFVLALALGAVFFFSLKDRSEEEARILFVGDMMFDRHIRKAMYEKGEDYPFSCIGDFLKNSDLTVGNLEGPITENASRSLFSVVGSPDNFVFTFPTATAKLIFENNVRVVSLGNNHIGNFGKAGIESTKKFLNQAEVGYFGGLAGDEPVHRTEINNHKISFIAYNEFGGESAAKVSEKIALEKKEGRTVTVFAHWGEEYVAPPQRVRNAAKLFAESGADLIIGAHPHVILENEMINNVPVYYSLGNFIFDQYWNEEVSTGLIVEVKIKNGKIETSEHKVSILRDGRTCLANL